MLSIPLAMNGRLIVIAWGLLALAADQACSAVAGEPPQFYRAINLNGPALRIDENAWEAGDARGVVTDGLSAFENQSVRLLSATDENRARMIRSSRWSPAGKATLRVTDVPAGPYSVYLYLWEDNDPQTFDILLAGKLVAKGYSSGAGGHWDRLGPWGIEVADGVIELSAIGGHANLSGIEIWRGRLGEKDHPLKPLAPPAVARTLESDAAVLLARNCLECHNASDRKGGLDLSRRQAALAGGDEGAAIIPGDPDNSLAVQHIESGLMPPRGRTRLASEDGRKLRDWIKSGALWAADPIDPFLYTSDRRAGYNWWSLQPLRKFTPPSIPNGFGQARNAIDNFVLQRLEKAGLAPSPESDRRTLIRRLSFDLLGLPPSPEDVEAFVRDPDPQAYERLVDRLLDSPHYGERWARHWLDIVRFGESQGFERNKLRPNAWKYRDFVVEAFNSDLPYNDFVRWQLAGDVLRPDDPLAVIASGFLALGPYDLTAYNNGTPDMRAFAREEELEGLVGSVGQTFLGLTINCSRCHDHKFDPVTQREFYQISAALGGTYQGAEREGIPASAKHSVDQRITALTADVSRLQEREKSGDERTRRELAPRRQRHEAVIRLLQGGPVHTTVPKQPGTWRILTRGDFRHPGDVVVPRGVAAVAGVAADWGLNEQASEADRRRALADWIADEHNPLTPRVIVNRLWGYHFGEGLVTTPSDFGFQGGQPSHPELLDWLADQLVHPTAGPAWSLKQLQRLIVTSATYRQGAGGRADSAKDPHTVDADNRLLWRHTRQRLEAETFRDAVLAVSGDLDLRMGGAGYRDFKISSAGDNETYAVFDAVGPEFNRRSLYRTCVRAGTSPLLDTLDCPDPSVPTPRRSATSTALQALTLLNDAFVAHYAERFAERLKRDAGEAAGARIGRAYALCFARQPTSGEIEFGERFIADHGLVSYCVVLLNTNEFLYVD